MGREAGPAIGRKRELLAQLAERRLMAGQPADLELLLHDLLQPPITHVGNLELNKYLGKAHRNTLAAALNTFLVSPTFSALRKGTNLDVAAWMTRKQGRTPAVVVSVAHLSDDERMMVLGVVLEEIAAWVRSLSASSNLRALIVFDELRGFMPPNPHSPPTKAPLLELMQKARGFGVGVLLSTQNPMDLDYRSVGNAGVWCVGRLQTDADRKRLVDGLAAEAGGLGLSKSELAATVSKLARRWFLMRDVYNNPSTILVQARHTLSWLRGPMTEEEVKRARELRAKGTGAQAAE